MEGYYFYNGIDEHGNHEVHTESCKYLPSESNRTYIGRFNSCKEAIEDAEAKFPTQSFDGCFWCCRECHTG